MEYHYDNTVSSVSKPTAFCSFSSFTPIRPSSMSSPTHDSKSANVRHLLSAVRWRIRWLVLLEGVALAFICFVVLFWIALAADYLPVKFGFQELTKTARTVILVISSIVLLAIFYQTILRRIFVALHDRSLSLLIEQKHPQFAESLITTVEYESGQTELNSQPSLLQLSREKANRLAADVDAKSVLNDSHVRRYLYGAAAALLSVVVFAIAGPSSLETAFSRLYFLAPQQWTRTSKLKWVALKVEFDSPVSGIPEFDQAIAPADTNAGSPTTFRVAKGATLNLTVKARSPDELPTDPTPAKKLPRTCKLHFQTADGNYGSQTLNKVGGVRAGWQSYRLQGAPLSAITSDVSFTILGGDFRLGPYLIAVVDEPIVTTTELDCEFPKYMQDENSMRGSARTIPWLGKTELPLGTKINMRVTSSKPLQKVYAVDSGRSSVDDDDSNASLANHQHAVITDTGFEFAVDDLTQATAIQFFMLDTDGVLAQSPHTVSLSPIADQPPVVEAALVGIGSSITPSAVLPVEGTVEDDYDVDAVWMEIETPVTDTLQTSVSVGNGGRLEASYDFQAMALQQEGGFVLPASGAEISLVVKASDRFDLSAGAHVGIGDEYTLTVVSASELLQILEQLEVGQRKRLELIFNEVSDIREYLIRTRKQNQRPSIELQPGEISADASAGNSSDSARADRQRNDLRKLFAQRAILQIDKSSQEIIGVAESFEDIRLQLINNRVDSEDRKIRLAKKIVEPLRAIPGGVMTELRAVVDGLETALTPQMNESSDAGTAAMTESAIQLTDKTLIQIDEVLSILVKYETQNELLDIVRRMIAEQEELLDQTKKLRQREAFDDLFE
jgi:hypothetical protein